MLSYKRLCAVAAVALFVSGALPAASNPSPAKSAPTVAIPKGALIFSSPPRESEEAAKKLYQPLADYLSKVLGKPVVYKYPRTYGVYRTEMINGGYDIVFDGAHFIGYRIQQHKHNALVRFPTENRTWVVFTRKDGKINTVSELAGQAVCAQPRPTLGSLVVLSQFDSEPTRQPLIVPVTGAREATYQAVMAGHCAAGVLPITELKPLDQAGLAKVLHERAIADQGFSAGPRVSSEDQAKIAAALLAPESAAAMEGVRARFYKGGEALVRAKNEEYLPFADLLRNEWGFYNGLPDASKPDASK
jgi:ABC-type phosphate/phosphonate transport system substrate-binding protein